MASRGMRQYNEHNDLMQLAAPEDAPAPEEFDPFQHTNEVNPMDYAEDNDPNRLEFAKGGVVPNPGGMRRGPSGSTDTVPAMLTPEEYVVPRDVVLKKGTDFFDKIRDQARGMDKKGAAGPQAVPGPQGEMRAGYEKGGLIKDLYDGLPQAGSTLRSVVGNGIDNVKNTVSQRTQSAANTARETFEGVPQAVDTLGSLISGPQAVAGPAGEMRAGYAWGGMVKRIGEDFVDGAKALLPKYSVDQAKADYSQPTVEMPGWIPNAVPKVANAMFNPIARAAGMSTDPNTGPQPSQFPDMEKTLAVQTDIKANPAKYPQPENAWGFDPAKRFIETPTGGGMTRKTMSPEYSKYLDQGGKPLAVDDNASVPRAMTLEGIPAGMSREQFAQNKNFDQYMTYAEKEQALAGKAADADYARQRANIVEETKTNVVPLGDGAFASFRDTNKNVPGLINTATVKPNDFMTQQNALANNTMDNLTEMQKEAMKESRAGLLKQNEQVKQSFAGLDETLLGGWNKTKGEATPGMAADEPEQAANYFKAAVASTGVPSTVFDGLAVVMPVEGSNIMTIYDPKQPNGPKLSGTPTELATKIYEDHNSRR